MPSGSGTGARVSHVGLAVRSIADAAPFYRDVLGLPEVELEDTDGAVIRGFDAAGSIVELLEPDAMDTPVGRFIAKRGPGIHHICFAVEDLDGTLERCRVAGVRLVDQTPRTGAEGKRIAFLHPESTGGILVELTER